MLISLKDFTYFLVKSSLPDIIVIFALIMIIRVAYLFYNSDKFVLYEELLNILFIIYILSLYKLVMMQDINLYNGMNLIPFSEILKYPVKSSVFIKNILGNVFLFIPYGFFMLYYLKKCSLLLVTSMSLLASFTIEFFQYQQGRIFDIDDIILNILGGIIGAIIYRLLFKELFTKLEKKPVILNIIISLLVIIFLGFIIWWLIW